VHQTGFYFYLCSTSSTCYLNTYVNTTVAGHSANFGMAISLNNDLQNVVLGGADYNKDAGEAAAYVCSIYNENVFCATPSTANKLLSRCSYNSS